MQCVVAKYICMYIHRSVLIFTGNQSETPTNPTTVSPLVALIVQHVFWYLLVFCFICCFVFLSWWPGSFYVLSQERVS